MTSNEMERAGNGVEDLDELTLGSRLSELERLPGWIDAIAARFGFTENTRFAVQLCLEEAVSNVIRHGYANQDGQFLTVQCTEPHEGYVVFTVEDNAAPFNPLESAALPAVGDQDPSDLGGQGIRLMRGFADTLEYEAKAGGNRLILGFSNAGANAGDL